MVSLLTWLSWQVTSFLLFQSWIRLRTCLTEQLVEFYLPDRYLFLVENYRYGRTWPPMWAAMLPIAWLILVG